MQKFRFLSLVLLVFSFITFSCSRKTEWWLPRVIGDNMMLQRDTALTLWGKTNPRAEVTIQFRDKTYQTRSQSDGRWEVKLEAQTYGGPFEMKLNSGDTVVFIRNIMVGDVWICSGQSNMDFPLEKAQQAQMELQSADQPKIRLFKSTQQISLTELDDLASENGWETCTPATATGFSAVAYFYARELAVKTGIPQGLIQSSWGGTPAQGWMDEESLRPFNRFAEALAAQRQKATKLKEFEREQEKKVREWARIADQKDDSVLGPGKQPSRLKYNDSIWSSSLVPGIWENTILPDFDGIVYYRKTFMLNEEPINSQAVASLGTIDDADVCWINGKKIGETWGYDKKRSYKFDARYLKKGRNVIAVKVYDTFGGGGFSGDSASLFIAVNNDTIPLAGLWKYKSSVSYAQLPAFPRDEELTAYSSPTVLFNAMIAPLTKLAVKGVIWYQGEANVREADEYKQLFPALITSWRKRFMNSNMPFYFVQLANFEAKGSPDEGNWPLLREAQLQTLQLPNTGMAVTIDIGDANDIHPTNKQEVGRRLALWALDKTYGFPIIYSGPLYRSYHIEGNKIIIEFDFVGGGLVSKNDPLTGFEICDTTGKYWVANARIVNQQVQVSHPTVLNPVSVRYGWYNNPIGCNLYNVEGLPASPFRTK